MLDLLSEGWVMGIQLYLVVLSNIQNMTFQNIDLKVVVRDRHLALTGIQRAGMNRNLVLNGRTARIL